MEKSRTIFGWLIVLGAFHALAYAQESPVTCRLESAIDKVTFGDSFTVECTIGTAPGVLVTDPAVASPSAEYDIQLSWQRHDPAGQAGPTERYGYTVHTFALDTLRIGPFVVQVTDQAGKQYSVTSNTLEIPVISVLDSTDTGLKPNRAPMDIPSKGIPRWLIALLGAAVIGAIAAFLLMNRSRRFVPAATAFKPLDEIEEIAQIGTLGLIEEKKYKEFYLRISAAVRGFMHRNMGFDAMFETTGEIDRALVRSTYDASIAKAFSTILKESDQVLFAKYSPSPEQASSAIERTLVPLREVLEENRRRIEAAELEAARKAPAVMDAQTAAAPVSPTVGENQ